MEPEGREFFKALIAGVLFLGGITLFLWLTGCDDPEHFTRVIWSGECIPKGR
jgi:hypothetical protein